MSARYSPADYAAAARALMPSGRVWPDDPDSVQGRALGAVAQSFARTDADAVDLVTEAFPATTDALLPEWEGALGLPDVCAGGAQTVGQRKAQVLTRFIGGGGQSRQRFFDFAAALGVTITIRTYAPFRVGQDRVGAPLFGVAWAFAWGITIVGNTSGISSDVLLCELRAIRPAETTILLLT